MSKVKVSLADRQLGAVSNMLVRSTVNAVPHSTSGKGDRRMAHEQVQALLKNAKRLRMRLDKAGSDPVKRDKLHAMLENTLAKVSIIGSAHYGSL